MDHADLVAELNFVEKLSAAERIQLAKQRRTLQLIRWHERERSTSTDDKAESLSKRVGRHRVGFSGNISLLDATARNDVQEVTQLLQQGIDPDCRNEDGLTALHQCAVDNNETILRVLLSYGANVNVRDSEMWTPLHAAACCGHLGIIKLLVKNGAELMAVNSDGNMPYDVCDDDEALDYIETEMANRGITQEDIDEERLIYEKQMLAELTKVYNSGGCVDCRDEAGATPLHIAAAYGYYTVVEFLLECGVWIHVRDNDGWQPIHAAAYWGQPDVLELLVQFGADINARTSIGETPLDLCEDDGTRNMVLALQMEVQRRNLLQFARDSRRMSKRRKPTSKFESPSVSSSSDNRFSSTRSAVRRMSIRDRTGVTLARLEAQREAALMRNWSFDEADRDKGNDDMDQEDSSITTKPSDTTIPSECSSSLLDINEDAFETKDRSGNSQTTTNADLSLESSGAQAPPAALSKNALTRGKFPAMKWIARPQQERGVDIKNSSTGGAIDSSFFAPGYTNLKPSVVIVSDQPTLTTPIAPTKEATPPKTPVSRTPDPSQPPLAEPLTLSDLKKKRSEVRSSRPSVGGGSTDDNRDRDQKPSNAQQQQQHPVAKGSTTLVTNNNANVLEIKAKKQSSLKCCSVS